MNLDSEPWRLPKLMRCNIYFLNRNYFIKEQE